MPTEKQDIYSIIFLGDAGQKQQELINSFISPENKLREEKLKIKNKILAVNVLEIDKEKPDTIHPLKCEHLPKADLLLVCLTPENISLLMTMINDLKKTIVDFKISKPQIIFVYIEDTEEEKQQHIKKDIETLAEQVKKKISSFFVNTSTEDPLKKIIRYAYRLDLEINQFCDDMIEKLNVYESSGNKFWLFSKNTDRDTTIVQVRNIIKQFREDLYNIKSQKILVQDLYQMLYLSKLETISSHRNNSVIANLGITSSRFAETLDECLKDFVEKGLLSETELPDIEDKAKKQHRENRASLNNSLKL